jgi:hypothetical protein
MSLTQPPLITANHISFSYGHENVLDNVSIQILPGDFVGLIVPQRQWQNHAAADSVRPSQAYPRSH